VTSPHVVPPEEELRDVFGPAGTGGGVGVEPLGHSVVASATAGLWRIRCGGRSAVVKVLAHSTRGHANWQSGLAEDHWFYWRREAAAYQSGLLGSFAGGLRAPECYLVAERDDGSVAVWLEDLQGAPGTTWPQGRYGIAAQQLGQAQGQFVTDRPLPTHPWLSRRWLRAYLRQRDRDMALLKDRSVWRHPLVATWFPDPPVEELIAMRDRQELFLGVLDQMPPTVSHLDLHPANLFNTDGHTTVIDWAFVGIGATGEDAGNLVPDAVLDFHVAPERLNHLYDDVANGYHAGLQAAGWDPPLSQVRLAMAATMATKYAWIAPAILRAINENRDQLNRRPLADALEAWAPTVHFLLARAREATDLTGKHA
jgi:hypothetical protein